MTAYNRPALPRRRLGLADLAVAALVLAVLYASVHLGAGMTGRFAEAQREISLNPIYLPYYAGRSLLRMFLAFAASIVFTLIYGYVAAKNRAAEKVLVPLLDILQSVPVLGFLSATVTAFMALFPGRLTGVELASIFAIFTGQVWNMTFSFYHSLVTVPRDLLEAARIYRLNWWQRFVRLEVPYAMIGLVWNSMMSFGGGWFFLAASEAISVLNTRIRLPGLGTYLAVSLEQRNLRAVLYAIATMIAVIVLVDQVFWRPVVAWAQRFKLELTESTDEPTSAVLTLLRRSVLVGWFVAHVFGPASAAFNRMMIGLAETSQGFAGRAESAARGWNILRWILLAALSAWVIRYAWLGARLVAELQPGALLGVLWLGIVTMARVLASTVLGALWAVPVGVAIGLNARLSRIAQPMVQIAASFPANMAFPFITVLYLKFRVNFELGAIPLMMLGTQWYILFNVIAGAMAIPTDLQEAASVFKLRGWSRWRRLILPGIFPFLVTGCVTAAGGAWNASIVAEVVSWGEQSLTATGLGAYISRATASGNWPGIIWGILVMAAFVVGLNRLLWHRLYSLAETTYRIG
ncbi:MAG: ABC transporter permease subunit [Actinobacteria bacterium]|nr:ABC transporter permease subunit [Actinomycetota bacterium]